MNRSLLLTLLVILLGLSATAALAQDDGEVTEPQTGNGHGLCQFIDEDGDGFNDLAPDDDGDGIPNGMDPDYVKPEDGDGLAYQWGKLEEFLARFGIQTMAGEGAMNLFQYGPGDGTGQVGPNEDGVGFGPGTTTGEGSGTDNGQSGNSDEDHGSGREDRGGGR